MTISLRHLALVVLGSGLAGLGTASAWADGPVTSTTTVVTPVPSAATNGLPAPSTTMPGSGAPLVGLDGSGLALAPPGAAAAARNVGLAGSGGVGAGLDYTPAADRDSYFNSKDWADHLNAFPQKPRKPSALSQIGGAAEGMAINGALGEGTSLLLGGH